MNVKDERTLDVIRNVHSPVVRKEIVRSIQSSEGNVPCFAARRAVNCPETDCFWREECIKFHQ